MYGLALIHGFFAAAAAVLVQVIFLFFADSSFDVPPSVFLLLGAATLEEGSRLIFLIQLAKNSPRTTSFLHVLLFGLGFIAVEFSLLILSPSDLPGIGLIAQTALIHLFGTIALYTGLRFRKDFFFAPYFALLTAILFHTLYNASL